MAKLSAQSNKCPSCGYNLVYSAEERMLTCSFCGSSYSPEKIDLLSQIVIPDQGEAEEDEEERQEIICNSCGAKIVADNNTSATFCAFCGSPSLVVGRLTRRFHPDYVIPFKITKDEALAKIKEFAAGKKYAPKGFLTGETIKKITGMYVPFWLMDSHCEMHTYGTGYKDSVSGKEKYSVVSEIDIALKNVPFDGAIDMRDVLMESIEPFDCSEMRPFASSYLQGFYAQRYDQSVDKLSDRILARLRKYGREAAAESAKGYYYYRTDACVVSPYALEQKYALFPVWILTYEYKGAHYQIAVNGQTGKVDGELPVSGVKKALRLTRYYLVNASYFLPVILLILAMIFWARMEPEQAFVAYLIIGLTCSAAVPMLAVLAIAKDVEEATGKYNILNPVRRGLNYIFGKRRAVRQKIREEMDMNLSPDPSLEHYYDYSFKADVDINEVFVGYETFFEDEK